MTTHSPDEPGLPALRLLVAVAEQGSLGAAAREIGMAQSNASRALAGLERRLGFAVVHRSAAGSDVTPEGALVVGWAREVVEAMDRLMAGAGAVTASAGGAVTVAASMTIAEYLAPVWLAALRRVHADAAVSLEILNSDAVIEAVRHARVAVGFVESPDVPDDVSSRLVGRDRLMVIIPPEHPWAERRGAVTVGELAGTSLVEREPGSGTRRFLDRAAASAGVSTRATPVAQLSSNAAIVAAVAAGLGPAVLSNHAVRGALMDGRVLAVPVEGGQIERELRAVWMGAPPRGVAGRLVDVAASTQTSTGP